LLTSPSSSQRTCSNCNAKEASLPVSLFPCNGCRTTFYCSNRCRKIDLPTHKCPKSISDRASFSRNCYIRFSQMHDSTDSFSFIGMLDDERRQHLLDEAHQRILATQERTQSIHQQIRTWNSGIAEQFQKRPAPFSESPLRVLHSSWNLIEEMDLSATTSFVALSYCWRSPEWEAVAESYRPPGDENGVPICRCLWDFLLGLLESEEEAIWIDQLCINQKNDIEKRSAVASMDTLYASARLVFVAIEDIFLKHDEVVLLSEAFRQVSEESDWTFTAAMASRVFVIVKKIFSARWFHRAWCFHEYHLSADRVLAIPCEKSPGSHSFSAVGLYNLGEFIFRLSYFQNEQVREQNSELIKQMLEFFGGQDYAFSNIIANTFHYGSKHPEDKLSIALNICQLDLSINPDIITSDEARLYLLILALAAGDATILTTRGPKVQYGEARTTSWLHWPNETSWSTRHPFPLPKGISSLALNHAIIDLLFIPHASFQIQSNGALRRAKSFLRSQLADKIRVAYNLQDKEAKYEEDQGTIETLSCALDCGLSWMARAWHRIHEEVMAEVDQSFEAVKQHKADVLIYLFGRYKSAGAFARRTCKPLTRKPTITRVNRFVKARKPRNGSTSKKSRLSTNAGRYVHAAFRMVLCIMLFGPYWEFGTRVVLGAGGQLAMSDLHIEQSSFRVPIPSEHKLYTAANYSIHPKGRTLLAVPRLLASKRFSMSDRLWLVEPIVDGSELCWRVREKVCLLGCAAIRADTEHVREARWQKIVG
jgi:uncharacterized protein YceK